MGLSDLAQFVAVLVLVLELTKGRLGLTQGRLGLTQGRLRLTQGRLGLAHGRLRLTQERLGKLLTHILCKCKFLARPT